MHSAGQDVAGTITQTVAHWLPELCAVAHDLHAHPELNFAEVHAHDVLTDLLERAGMHVQRHAHGLDTAFTARAGSTGPTVAVLCEYDALEGIGHACGHNVIATAGVGAGLAAAAVAEQLGGRVVVIGCPAEEGGGGKIALLEAGAFDDVSAAMMVHPADRDLTRMDAIAVAQFRAVTTGAAAHAAAAPQLGRNALDAAVLGYMNVAALRQHIAPDERIHGIFLEAGQAANIVPERAVAHWMVRAATLEDLDALVARVEACLQAGATAAGCGFEFVECAPRYAEMVDNPVLLQHYAEISAALGRPLEEPDAQSRVVGSTDMGNVSRVVPSIHPMLRIAPSGTAIHTVDFAASAVSEEADRAIGDAAQAMAQTVAALWRDPEILASVQMAFDSP